MDTRKTRHKPENRAAYARRNFFKKLSWGAIIGGALLALTLMVLLNLLGMGMGLGHANEWMLASVSTSSIIWWVASLLLSVFGGAYVAGRFSEARQKAPLILQGILCWSVFTLAWFWLLISPMGNIIGGVGYTLSQTMMQASAGEQPVDLMSDKGLYFEQQASVDFYGIQREVLQMISSSDARNRLRGTDEASESSARSNRVTMQNNAYISDDDIMNIMQTALYKDGELVKRVDKQEVAALVNERTNLGPEVANGMADILVRKHAEAKNNYKEAKAEAALAAERREEYLSTSASRAARLIFISLVLGAAVGGGGSLAARIKKPAATHKKSTI